MCFTTIFTELSRETAPTGERNREGLLLRLLKCKLNNATCINTVCHRIGQEVRRSAIPAYLDQFLFFFFTIIRYRRQGGKIISQDFANSAVTPNNLHFISTNTHSSLSQERRTTCFVSSRYKPLLILHNDQSGRY